jgi:hypothetical protein
MILIVGGGGGVDGAGRVQFYYYKKIEYFSFL